MLLIFKRLNDYITFEIDRKNKKLKIKGEQTNYREEESPWRMLWDKCEYHKKNQGKDNIKCLDCDKVAESQDKETESLSDKDFVKVFENQMKVYAFKLAKWES